MVIDASTKTAWANIEQAGATAYDTARDDGAPGIAPTGPLVFAFFSNGTCADPVAHSQTVNLFDGAVPNSAVTVTLPKGRYSYQTTYQGDANYLSVTSRCEPFTVGKTTRATPKGATTPPPATPPATRARSG